MLLGAHQQACTIGELKLENLGDIGSYRCSCGSPIMECEFWTKIRNRMRNRQCDFSLDDPGTSVYQCSGRYAQRFLQPLHRGRTLELARDAALLLSSAWRRHLARFRRNYHALAATALAVTGARILVDSSKQALQLKYILTVKDLDVKVLRLVRDGRAVGLTGIDKATFADATDPALRYGGAGKHDGSQGDSMAQATRNWLRSNEAGDSLVKRLHPSQWMRLRYEDLCADPGRTMEAICKFLDLDTEGVRLDFRVAQNHLVGNGMRLDKTSDIRLDERWRNHLSPEDLEIFDQLGGNLNGLYGYK